ncbi:hypothetical protein ACFY8N_39410 [Streptomyces collinus]|uniref:hypothetical protein n=1 Tax=Streptomyces collinus TaxID=42684 RepID=UPI00367DE634
MNSAEAARKLGVEAASLSPAPAAPQFAETWKRMQKLREAAADARLRLHTYTDESGWEGE